MPFTPRSSAVSHIGLVRSQNEDAFLDKPETGLWVIADGMGGHEAGDLASQMIVESLDEMVTSQKDKAVIEQVKSTLYTVNTNLINLGEQHERVNGSTALAMLMNDNHCDYVWAGDSRLYLHRDNKLEQLTRDHSQAEIYVELGMLTREEAANHVSANLLTRCIGTDEALLLDSGSCEFNHGDRFLLSSDGLDKHVSHQAIEQVLNENGQEEALNQLVAMTLENGGTDNVTITIVDIMSS